MLLKVATLLQLWQTKVTFVRLSMDYDVMWNFAVGRVLLKSSERHGCVYAALAF